MSVSTPIDLSTVPAPNVVEELTFETIVAAMLADLQARDPAFTALVESDPAYKILEVCAYRELLIRQRVNDGARAVMLAYSTGTDLDNLAANFGVTRLTIDPGDAQAIPPVAPTYETDAALRRRVLLSLESLSVAGPRGAYEFHTRSVAGVKDCAVDSPTPGTVRVVIIGNTGDGTPSAQLISDVEAALNDDDVRPLTDTVSVVGATIVPFTIEATIYTNDGPDPEVVIANCEAAAAAYASSVAAVGADVTLSGVYAALHQAGVSRVVLTSPAADILTAATAAPSCTAITLTHGNA